MVQLRHAHIETLRFALQQQDKNCDPTITSISQLYLKIALEDDDGYLIWTAMNNDRIIDAIETEINIIHHDYDDKLAQAIRKSLIMISNRLAALTIRLWTKRAEIIKFLVRRINQQNKSIKQRSNNFQELSTKPNKAQIQPHITIHLNPVTKSRNTNTNTTIDTITSTKKNRINPAIQREEQRRHYRLKRGFVTSDNNQKIKFLRKSEKNVSNPTSIFSTLPQSDTSLFHGTTEKSINYAETVTHYIKHTKTDHTPEENKDETRLGPGGGLEMQTTGPHDHKTPSTQEIKDNKTPKNDRIESQCTHTHVLSPSPPTQSKRDGIG
jgi:hypothetical protein